MNSIQVYDDGEGRRVFLPSGAEVEQVVSVQQSIAVGQPAVTTIETLLPVEHVEAVRVNPLAGAAPDLRDALSAIVRHAHASLPERLLRTADDALRKAEGDALLGPRDVGARFGVPSPLWGD